MMQRVSSSKLFVLILNDVIELWQIFTFLFTLLMLKLIFWIIILGFITINVSVRMNEIDVILF